MSQKKEIEERQEQLAEEIRRVKLPRGRQVFGLVDQLLGGTRMRVKCFDGKLRICRIPGRFKRFLWVRAGDTILVEPWELSGDKRGDVLFKYSRSQLQYLRNKGLLKDMQVFEEF
ncbi:TPA: translation initiation factor eIF-1A [Candidatus Woesearchaeota archaeon]|nr:translation initiation factor eIF-1A [Candidatus Woesearchaeota archaeon]